MAQANYYTVDCKRIGQRFTVFSASDIGINSCGIWRAGMLLPSLALSRAEGRLRLLCSIDQSQQPFDTFGEFRAWSDKTDDQVSIRREVVEMARLHQHILLAK